MTRCVPVLLSVLLSLVSVAGAREVWAQPPPQPAVLATTGVPDPAAVAALWDALPGRPPAPLYTAALVAAEARRAATRWPDLVTLESIGQSVEGRDLWHLSLGRGPLRVLLWSQMHGDEPSATPALFDLIETLASHPTAPRVARLLDRLTLHIVPMLNPDGAERFQRRNAQSIDINRDALRLQTPEGRALKALRDRLQPAIGFNLHNQGWRTSVGRPPRPATISLLSVAFDEARSDSPGRQLTRKVSAVIRDALEPFIPGQIGRYDDEFEVRAFGDNITRWGTPVVLIEAGPVAGSDPDRQLTRLNFIGLFVALDAIASGRVHEVSTRGYDELPVNEDRLFHTLITNATVIPGTGVPPFLADVGVTAQRVVRSRDGERTVALAARIDDVGDLRVFGALEVIDATGLVLAPLVDPGAVPGMEVRLDERAVLPVRIAVGEPAALLLLRRGPAAGVHVVERVVRVGDVDRRAP